MKKSFGAKTLLFPTPVLMVGTYDENGKANLMNAAWMVYAAPSLPVWLCHCVKPHIRTTVLWSVRHLLLVLPVRARWLKLIIAALYQGVMWTSLLLPV